MKIACNVGEKSNNSTEGSDGQSAVLSARLRGTKGGKGEKMFWNVGETPVLNKTGVFIRVFGGGVDKKSAPGSLKNIENMT